jgi:hypothetical protein
MLSKGEFHTYWQRNWVDNERLGLPFKMNSGGLIKDNFRCDHFDVYGRIELPRYNCPHCRELCILRSQIQVSQSAAQQQAWNLTLKD